MWNISAREVLLLENALIDGKMDRVDRYALRWVSILFCIRTPKQSPFTPVLKVRLRGRNFCVGEAPKISFYLKEKSSAATGSASSAWWHVL